MNKIIVLVFIVLSLIGCYMLIDNNLLDKAGNHTLYYGDYSEVYDISRIDEYMTTRVDYRADDIDVWENPETILNRSYGDCDDFAILYLNILYIKFGIKGSIVAVDMHKVNKSIVAGGFVGHALIMYEGQVFSPRSGCCFGSYESLKDDIGYIYSFDEVFTY